MDDRMFNFVLRGLRRLSYKWPSRSLALKHARLRRGIYECNHCKGEFRPKEVEVDHIIPVIPLNGSKDFDVIIPRLFCDTNGLQVLCKPCHKKKSKKENEVRKDYRHRRKKSDF